MALFVDSSPFPFACLALLSCLLSPSSTTNVNRRLHSSNRFQKKWVVVLFAERTIGRLALLGLRQSGLLRLPLLVVTAPLTAPGDCGCGRPNLSPKNRLVQMVSKEEECAVVKVLQENSDVSAAPRRRTRGGKGSRTRRLEQFQQTRVDGNSLSALHWHFAGTALDARCVHGNTQTALTTPPTWLSTERVAMAAAARPTRTSSPIALLSLRPTRTRLAPHLTRPSPRDSLHHPCALRSS